MGDMNARFERLLASGALERAAAEPDLAGSDDARDEEFVPELRAERVRDSGGSIRSDARTRRDHFGTGEVRDAYEMLSVEDMRHIASMRWRGRFF